MRRLASEAAAERDRWALWTPVGLGVGIGVYFGLPSEPPVWLGFSILIALAATAASLRGTRSRYPGLLTALTVTAATIALGFTLAQVRTMVVAAPVLEKRIGPTTLVGRIMRLETLPDGNRATLEKPRIAGVGPERTPVRVRVRLRGETPDAGPGDWLRVLAILAPPPPPAAPGAFDFQRQAYFGGLGGVGFAIGRAEITARSRGEGLDGLVLGLSRLRQHITERVRGHRPGAIGAVTAALMTGERGAIPESVMVAIRDSGLAHLLAISGLHIGLVAGVLFVGVRAGLALVPFVALRQPIKKWAALAAIAGALAYALLTGATVPSQRAFLMIGLVLLAVLVDRRGISMRVVAWAAVVVLLIQPESLLSASFQLSFAAVVALVSVYEAVRMRRNERPETPSWLRRAGVYLAGVAATTVIAGIATAPFAVFHFNRFVEYSLAANLVAVPVTALWIMPWAVGAFLLMPFGLDALALAPMGWGVGLVIRVAETVASWPGAVAALPAMPTWGLVTIAAGGLWLTLLRRRWRLWGTAGIGAGVASLLLAIPPDVLVDANGKLMAVRTDSGTLAVSSLRAAPFSRDVWLRRAGQDADASPWPRYGEGAGGRLKCDVLGCVYRTEGLVVALARLPEGLAEDCRLADVVVSSEPVRGRCDAAVVIDRFDLWRGGAHAVWLGGGDVRVESVNARRGDRPWVAQLPTGRRGGT